MSSDIVERLRDAGNGLFHTHPLGDYGICDEAADEIERLRLERAAIMRMYDELANSVEEVHEAAIGAGMIAASDAP